MALKNLYLPTHMKYLYSLFVISLCAAAGAGRAGAKGLPHTMYRAVADTDTSVAVHKRSLSVGVSYGSDALFFGRTGPITYPYMTVDAVYNTKGGFFVYGTALKLLGYPTLTDEVDVGGGYLYRFSKIYKFSASYNRFIFKDDERVIASAAANDLNVKNNFNWKLFQSSITFDYLFGKASDYFNTISISKYYETSFGIFDQKDYLTINPSISAILGTQNFVQRYTQDHLDRLAYESVAIFGDDHVPAYNNGRFNVLNYSFKIPIAYNRAHYTLEAAYKYSIPVNVEGALKNKRESFFNLTFYYVFY
jgi:hypothetical protein